MYQSHECGFLNRYLLHSIYKLKRTIYLQHSVIIFGHREINVENCWYYIFTDITSLEWLTSYMQFCIINIRHKNTLQKHIIICSYKKTCNKNRATPCFASQDEHAESTHIKGTEDAGLPSYNSPLLTVHEPVKYTILKPINV